MKTLEEILTQIDYAYSFFHQVTITCCDGVTTTEPKEITPEDLKKVQEILKQTCIDLKEYIAKRV